MIIPDFKLERYFARWEFVAPYLLCSSDVDGYQMHELLELADEESRELWQNLWLGYTESAGHSLLRDQIAGLYHNIAAEQVLTFAGGEEAIFVLMNVLLKAGEHAIVTWPGYQSLYTVAQSIGAEVTLLPLHASNGWHLDIEELRGAIKLNTKLIVINFPHNPTGAQLDQATYTKIVELAEESRAYLFSDESYRFLEYDPRQTLPAAVESSPRGISLGVLSKTFALAGLRIGWLATQDAEILRRAAAFKDYISICNSAPSEILALIALRARGTIIKRSLAIIQDNLVLLDRFFAEYSHIFAWQRPRAGSIAFPRLITGQPIEEFAEVLVKQEGVLLLPGSVYDHPGNHFRIGFGRKNMSAALERLEHFVSTNNA
ncbi:MAG: pyridoxal phosphate-dependent aminotransferase [Ktedonobacteraceae bacterium]